VIYMEVIHQRLRRLSPDKMCVFVFSILRRTDLWLHVALGRPHIF
jgi:hypothetical protein